MKRFNPCPPLYAYRNRDYVQHLLDDTTFDRMSADAHLGTSGCLDALDQHPAGSVVAHTPQYMGIAVTYRGVTLAELLERDALADELLKELK